MIAVFNLDFRSSKSSLLKSARVGPFTATSRTKSHVLFHVDNNRAQSFAFNPRLDEAPNSKKIYKNVM